MLWLFFSSFLTALSMPGFVAGCIVWFSLVPFLKSLEKKGPLFGALYGFLYFYAFSAINLYWVLPVLMENMPRTFGKFHALTGFLVFLLMLAFEALPFAAFGFLYGLLENSVKKHPIKEVLFTASAYTLFDFIRSLGEMGFTGGTLSDALYRDTGILQLAPIIGSYGLTFIIVAVNCWLYIIWRKSSRPIEKIVFVVLAINVISHLANIFLPLPHTSDQSLAAIQTNTSQDVKYNQSSYYLYEQFKPMLVELKDTLVVMPEDVFPFDPRGSDIAQQMKELCRQNNLQILIGTLSVNSKIQNSVFLVNELGFVSKYSKVKLFPFVERLPYEKVFGIFSFLQGLNYLDPGEEYEPLTVENYPLIGVQICFESYFSEPSRQLVKKGARVLLVCTNDGWFSFDTALKQHFAKAVIRAVETRRQVIQVSNAGITGSIDPYGRIVEVARIRSFEKVDFDIIPNEAITIYAKIGDLVIWFCLGIVVFMLFFPGERTLGTKRRIWK